MDRVRFGRALGYGARHAARSLVAAVDAATAPNPASPASPEGSQNPQRTGKAAQPEVLTPRVAAPVRAAQAVQAGRQASRSVLAPVKKATSVVMLQVSGSFFGLLAFGMGRGLWRLKDGFHAARWTQSWLMAWVVAVMVGVLAYFCVSNFVRAWRRERS